jgi:predicted transcriptional regulator
MKNSTKVQVHVGSLQDMATRFTNAWNQASKGVEVNETNVTFLDIQTMFDTLSPRRLDLLKYVRQNGANTKTDTTEYFDINKTTVNFANLKPTEKL